MNQDEKNQILIWDADYTKLTSEEAQSLQEAEESGFMPESEVDWEHIGINVEKT